MAAIKCECPKQCEIHPSHNKPDETWQPANQLAKDAANGINISLEDKLTLRDLEAQWMRSKLQASDAITQANQAHDQLNVHAKALFEKYGVDQQRFSLNMPELKFVAIPRG